MSQETVTLTIPEEVTNLVPPPPKKGSLKSADIVRQDINIYLDKGLVDADGLEALMKLFDIGKERKYSWDELGDMINYSSTTMSRLYAGKYDGSLKDVMTAVRAALKLEAERAKMKKDIFIETSTWHKINSACNLAIRRNAMTRVTGPSQIGKTFSMFEYKRRAAFSVHYIRIPAAPTFKLVIDIICQALRVQQNLRIEDARMRIPRAVSENTLIIVDELHELVMSAGKSTAMKVIEFLREIHDVSHCGMVLCGTKSMEDDLINDPKMRSWLAQTDQRCIRVVNLPNVIPEEDIDLVAAAYGISGSKACVESLLKTIRMNRLTTCLKITVAWCRKKNKPLNWESFKTIYKSTFEEEI